MVRLFQLNESFFFAETSWHPWSSTGTRKMCFFTCFTQTSEMSYNSPRQPNCKLSNSNHANVYWFLYPFYPLNKLKFISRLSLKCSNKIRCISICSLIAFKDFFLLPQIVFQPKMLSKISEKWWLKHFGCTSRKSRSLSEFVFGV